MATKRNEEVHKDFNRQANVCGFYLVVTSRSKPIDLKLFPKQH